MTASRFDRSFLPQAQFEFVVISDTHYIRDPDIYASGSDSQDPRFTRLWPARAEQAVRLAASLDAAFVVHLGDLAQEYPGRKDFAQSRAEARAQIERAGLQPYHAAGNMDIGDKPNPTVPAEWVTPESLAEWHRQFGRSWYSFDRHGVHGVVLNSQIMNGPLPEADEQRRWLEADLAEHAGQRIFIFLHMPPFFVDEHEPDLGYYDNLDEPARSWLLGLLRRYRVELLFSGHLHFAAFNRIDGTRLLGVPSTTTSRPGFYEVFSVLPDHQGKNDEAKLGFYLVQVQPDGARLHLIRTNGETGPHESVPNVRRLLTRLSPDLPDSPLGVYLRLPLAQVAEGVIAWPDAVRDRVRNDYPFLACLELGARYVRVPAADLADNLQRQRLALLRDEGVRLAGVWLWSEWLKLTETVRPYAPQLDSIEVQVPGTLWPEQPCLQEIARCRRELGIPLTLAPLLAQEYTPGKYHPRMRIGYRAAELVELNQWLSRYNIHVERVLGHIDPEADPWEAIGAFISLLPLSQINNFDFVVPLPGLDENAHVGRVAEAMLAAALLPGCRLFLDPLVDVDRASDINYGLLDRLCNPRPAFQAVRCLNTILFGAAQEFQPIASKTLEAGRVLGLTGRTRSFWLLLPEGKMSLSPAALAGLRVEGRHIFWFDLVAGTSHPLTAGVAEFEQKLSDAQRPILLMSAGAGGRV